MFGLFEKIKHRRLQNLLSSYIDGQVTESEVAHVEAHLEGCEPCRQELDLLKATISLFAELPELEVPRSFALSEAPVVVRQQPRFVIATRFAASAAALLFVAVLVGDATGLITQGGEGAKDFLVAPTVITESEQAVSEIAAAPLASAADSRIASAPVAAPTPDVTPPVPQAGAAPAPRAVVAAPAGAPVEEESGEEAPPMMLAAADDEAESATAQEEPAVLSKAGLPGAVEEPEMVTVISEDEDLTLPTGPSGEGAPTVAEPVEDDDGYGLPLWQLEVIFGGTFVVLTVGTLWTAYRRRRQAT